MATSSTGPAPKSSESASTKRSRVEDDFDESRYGVPGVVGRSNWFAERAGTRPDALSIGRLKRAISVAEGMLDIRALRESVAEKALSALQHMSKAERERTMRRPSHIDGKGKSHKLKSVSSKSGRGITTVADPVDVADAGFVVLPVVETAATHLDLETVFAAEDAQDGLLRLNHTFSYSPQERIVIGQVRHAGRYQIFALPKDPWIRVALETLAKHWRWIEHELVEAESTDGGDETSILDRICNVVLGASEYDQMEAEGPIGAPPRSWPGVGDLKAGFFRKGGAQLLLGEIPVINGRPRLPPVIKWWGDFYWEPVFPQYLRWTSIGPFPDPDFRGIGRVTQLDIHPTNGDVLIAGAAGGGVWRTTNGGSSWYPRMELQPTLTIGAVGIAASNPLVMYAASGEDADGYGPSWSGVGIYRSNNGGSNWTLMTSVPSTRFSAIVVHPGDPDIVYVAGNRGLHKSRDGGVTWLTNPGLDSLLDGQITDVVIASQRPLILEAALASSAAPMIFPDIEPIWADRVYIGVRHDGVYLSTSGGQQFGFSPAFTRLDGADQLPSGSAAGWPKLAIGRRGTHRSAFLAARLGTDGSQIFTTDDGGATWTEKAAGVFAVPYDEWCSVIAVDPTDEDVMYVGGVGLFRTTNGGATAADWVYIREGPVTPHADQQDIAFDPRDPRRIFLANDGGVWRSDDQGDEWVLASGGLAITQLYDIDISEKDRDIVAGGAQDNGIYYRDSAGAWKNIPYGDGTQVAIDPTDPQIVYFANQYGIPTGLARSLSGGSGRTDLSQTGLSGSSPWVTIIKLEPRSRISNPASNRVLFVCGINELFRSSDGGQSSWQRVEDPSGVPFQTEGTISALEFAPGDPSILYLATTSGAVYRGLNGGANAGDWTRIDTPGSPANALFPNSRVQAIGINRYDPDHVWLVFGGSGVGPTSRPDLILNPLGISHLFRNIDATNVNGWQDASGQFPALSLPDVPTSAIALSDFDATVAYVGTDVGVFRTTDGGVTWGAFQDGLPRCPVVELKWNRRFNRLFAGTMGRGVFARDVWG